MILTVPLPWVKPPLTQNKSNRSTNPYVKARNVAEAKDAARYAIKAQRLPFLPGANVTLHYRPQTRHRRDADGMCSTLKVVLDALVAEGVLHDDSWVEVPHSGHTIHPPAAGKPAEMWVEIELLEEGT